MDKLELRLIEAYKDLDIYLSERYDSEKGVTDYISRMEYCHLDEDPRYKDTYYKLKHVRWLRNSIMHDETNEPVKKEDIDFIANFKEDCISKLDPVKSSYRSGNKHNSIIQTLKLVSIMLVVLIAVLFIIFALINFK